MSHQIEHRLTIPRHNNRLPLRQIMGKLVKTVLNFANGYSLHIKNVAMTRLFVNARPQRKKPAITGGLFSQS